MADVLVMRVSIPHDGAPLEGDVVADPERLLTATEVARILGIRRDTWHAYVSRGQAPPADDPDSGSPANRRTPRWRLSTVRTYVQNKKRRVWKLPKG